MRIAPRGAVLAGLALLILALPSSSVAAPTWLEAEDLSAAGSAGGPKVALDAAGDAVTVWNQSAGGYSIVQATVRPAGGLWSPPESLSAAGQNAYEQQVAVDGAGNAVAVWRRWNGANWLVQSAVRPTGGAWSAPHDLSAPGQDALAPEVALDAAGNAVAVWQRSNGAAFVAQAAVRAAGGAWGTAENLSAGGAHSPQVAVDPAGNAIAVWYLTNGTTSTVQAAVRPTGGPWGSPQDVSAPGDGAGLPQVGVDAAGDAVAVWDGSDGSNDIVQASARPAGGAWSPPQDLSALGQNAMAPQVALDPAGNADAVWERSNGSAYVIQAARRPAAGAWGLPQNLSVPGEPALDPEVALDPAGNAVAVWRHGNGGNDVIQASARPLGGNWEDPKDLSSSIALAPDVALDPSGNAVAVWARTNGTDQVMQAAALDAAGPVLAGLSIPPDGPARTRVVFAVSPFDVWSALAPGPTWSFGDGGHANGIFVSHVYARRGDYTVSVTQADAVGNESSSSRSLSIRAAPACVVPRVVGKRLAAARRAIAARHCRTGKVTGAYSNRYGKGRVLTQKPRAGRRLGNGARVRLVVSRGKRP